MSAFDLFKAGCELLAAGVQAFWDSLNLFEQVTAIIAGILGSALVLGSVSGWIAGKIGLCIRARKQRAVVPIPTGPLPSAGYGLISASTDMWLMVADIESGRYQFSEEE